MPRADRDRLVPRLLAMYANDLDPGTHGALAWALRRWGREADVKQIDQLYATGRPEDGRRWYVNGQGQTLVIVPAPGEVVIGSPPWEFGREDGPEGTNEIQRHVRIDCAFAIMARQVTVAEFLRFRSDFPYRSSFSPEPDCPINNVSWYDSVAYCNWLNEREGIPREQWCYLPNGQGEYAQGMRIAPDALGRTGYRLATEAEWEYACRAGAVTSRYYGQSAGLDNYYTWNAENSLGGRTALVGTFKPNDLGLFDMLGNAMHWCHTLFHDASRPLADSQEEGAAARGEALRDRRVRLMKGAGLGHRPEATPTGVHGGTVPGETVPGTNPELPGREVTNSDRFVIRGMGGFSPADFFRCSYATPGYTPNFRAFPWGLRVARTMTTQLS